MPEFVDERFEAVLADLRVLKFCLVGVEPDAGTAREVGMRKLNAGGRVRHSNLCPLTDF